MLYLAERDGVRQVDEVKMLGYTTASCKIGVGGTHSDKVKRSGHGQGKVSPYGPQKIGR